MSDFFKLNPARWMHGTVNLTGEQEFAYFKIICAIHLYDAALPYNPRVLAGLFKTGKRVAERLVRELVEAGKITIVDGIIHQERAERELQEREVFRQKLAEFGRKGGETSAKLRSKPLKTLSQGQAQASSRIEENRIEEESPLFDSPLKAPASPPPPEKRGTRLPDDWQPKDSTMRWATEERHIPSSALQDQLQRFRNYWTAKTRDATKFSWDKTFMNWMLKYLDDMQRNGRMPNGSGRGHRQQVFDNVRKIIDQRFSAKEGGEGGETGDEAPFLLPGLQKR